MRNAERTEPVSRFLGVRLSIEEEGRLEEFRRARGFSNRSEAVRALVREGAEDRRGAADLPITLRGELEELVEDGYARSVTEALSVAVSYGLAEIARQHGERWTELRSHARDLASPRRGRDAADREGRGLLRR
ncbi:MAG: ribbon-helix-helix domain-containing protein [Thermoplasmata archaeon]